MALFVVLFVHPTVAIPPTEYVLLILLIEVASVSIAHWISQRNGWRAFLQILLLSFLLAAAILIAFQPATANFEQLFAGIFILQILGLSLAILATRKGSNNQAAVV